MAARRIIPGAIALIAFALLISQAALAYDDTEGMRAHSMINQLAYESFQAKVMPGDPYLKNCSLNLDPINGIGMQEGIRGDWPKDIDDTLPQQRSMRSWIVFGGYTADEPELPNALTHFYNPQNSNAPWLTDQQYPVTFYKIKKLDRNVLNPQISAKELALHGTTNMKTENFNDYFIKEYYWDSGKLELQLALDSSGENNQHYGKAWRSLGEVMHLMADMTLPAHVRNDGHARTLLDMDPVEGTTTWEDVLAAAEGPYTSIDYYDDKKVASSPDSLFYQVAKWTQNNFMSKDTINQPILNGRATEKDGYMYWNIDGRDARVAKINRNYWVDTENPKISYTIDKAVVRNQLSFLIPTAVKADATLIDRFLPRFYATVSQNPGAKGATEIHVALVQKLSEEWPNAMTVNNGAYLVINGKKEPVTMGDGGSLNNYMVESNLNAGDTVYALFDFGGYEIKSNTITIEAQKATPKPAHSDPKVTRFDGPTGALAGSPQDLTFTYSVSVSGGTPPYKYTWCGDGRRVLFDGKEYSTVTVKAGDIRWNGEGYAISLFITDSAGEGAYWVDSVGTSSTEFVYFIKRDGTVQKPRGL